MHIGDAGLDKALHRWACTRKRDLGILSLECVGANGPTIIHAGTGALDGRGRGCLRNPDWAGRMASLMFISYVVIVT